jgi:hypothetical protein
MVVQVAWALHGPTLSGASWRLLNSLISEIEFNPTIADPGDDTP